ncbi:hypothetical protein [Alkalisalibacterium limincola]|uniref:DUF4034 domain-containing protein n=1 Tax=Alkalisalibacterium limincola TaxID=2699169 RepID=A0A5C8KNA2_9GAMM|nr:hypothetical protein [Alkalisalibacterium limincola]TXK60746.1 hypothetical protein FU658_11430 [Alkalisalibacterium limincola]
MKTLFVHVVLAIAVVVPGPASAQPGIDDPELLAWMHAANAAQHARYEALASREDPRSLLMAMHLVHPMFPLREDPETELAAEKARAWALLERAARVGPDDPLVAWKLANCPTDSGLALCGSPASRERLATVAGSHAASHLWLAQVAQAVGDGAAVETHLQAAAEAPSYSFEHEIGELVWTAWETIDFPEAGEQVAQAYGRHVEIDPDAFVDQVVALSVLARIAAHAVPGYQFPMAACGISGQGEAVGEMRRRQCLAIFTTMASEKPTLLQRMISDRALLHLRSGAPEAEDAKARLRTTWWIYEAGTPLITAMSTQHDPDHLRAWRERGEYQALVELMQRRGVATVPPDGWLPESEEARQLLDDDGKR